MVCAFPRFVCVCEGESERGDVERGGKCVG